MSTNTKKKHGTGAAVVLIVLCHSPFRPLHVDTPCLISKLYGKRRRWESSSADLHNNSHV